MNGSKETSVVECSFRAKPGFDVAQAAFSFGGGGHPAASGCTITGKLEDVGAQVIPVLKQSRRQGVGQPEAS